MAIEFLEYARKLFKELPANRWTAATAGGPIVVIDHTAGVDLARGPWVKFRFKREGDDAEYEVQGYKTWGKGDRIKHGASGKAAEVDDDHISFTAAAELAGAKLYVIIKFHFEQDETPFAFRFAGRTN